MSDSAAAYFGPMREQYDSLIRRAVPRYDEMIETLIGYLPIDVERVLELGCGTGNFSLALAACFPRAALTLVDAAPEMLELTRERLLSTHAAAAAKASFVTARFEDLELRPASLDLVTSCISLHHVADMQALFEKLNHALRPRGTLCFADQLACASERDSALHWQRWLDYCRLPGHCSEAELQGLLDHARKHDHYASVPAHLRLLEATGFVAVDCLWRNGMWSIIKGERT